MKKMPAKEMERRLGLQYAQLLKDTPANSTIYRDCQEVIEASLNVMDHYNRVSLAIKRRMPGQKTAGVFS